MEDNMQRVVQKDYFHIHDFRIFSSELWVSGNQFTVSKDFLSCFGKELKDVNWELAKLSGDFVCKREIALEEIRRKNFPEEISRLHCIWLCDEKSIDYWTKILYGDVFRVRVTGNIFQGSENYLFGEESNSYEEILEGNQNYWKSSFYNPDDIWKREYLFQGKVKVLEKCDIDEFL